MSHTFALSKTVLIWCTWWIAVSTSMTPLCVWIVVCSTSALYTVCHCHSSNQQQLLSAYFITSDQQYPGCQVMLNTSKGAFGKLELLDRDHHKLKSTNQQPFALKFQVHTCNMPASKNVINLPIHTYYAYVHPQLKGDSSMLPLSAAVHMYFLPTHRRMPRPVWLAWIDS